MNEDESYDSKFVNQHKQPRFYIYIIFEKNFFFLYLPRNNKKELLFQKRLDYDDSFCSESCSRSSSECSSENSSSSEFSSPDKVESRNSQSHFSSKTDLTNQPSWEERNSFKFGIIHFYYY
jgi:hypothetical protein